MSEEIKEENQEEQRNPEKDSKKLIIAIGILFLIFATIILIRLIYNPTETTLDGMFIKTLEGKTSDTNFMYNGFAFVYYNGLWYSRWQRDNEVFNIALHYNPKELEDIIIEGNIDERFHQDSTYITFDPTKGSFTHIALGVTELSLSMTRVFNVMPVAACSKNETLACSNRPIVDCDTNASVIYFKEEPDTKIIGQGNCIIIQGTDEDIARAANRLIYMWYGIM